MNGRLHVAVHADIKLYNSSLLLIIHRATTSSADQIRTDMTLQRNSPNVGRDDWFWIQVRACTLGSTEHDVVDR